MAFIAVSYKDMCEQQAMMLCTQEELRDQVWSFNELWGEERVAVRKFLKDEWKKNNKTEQVATNYVDAKNEADSILEVSYSADLNAMPILMLFSGGGKRNIVHSTK